MHIMKTKTLIDDEHGKVEYKQLEVRDGDVIVVKAGISQGAIDRVSELLGQSGKQNCIFVAVEKMSDIKSLPPEVMSRYGWYKADRLAVTSRYIQSRIEEERGKEDSIEGAYQGIHYMLTGKYHE